MQAGYTRQQTALISDAGEGLFTGHSSQALVHETSGLLRLRWRNKQEQEHQQVWQVGEPAEPSASWDGVGVPRLPLSLLPQCRPPAVVPSPGKHTTLRMILSPLDTSI